MTLKTAGLLSPGDMGHIVGNVLVSHGLRVITCLGGKKRTHQGPGKTRGNRRCPDIPGPCTRS